MSLLNLIKKAELATLEIAAGDDEWWSSQTKQQQKDYIAKHPRSKYAKNSSSSSKPAKPSSSSSESKPKLRGPAAFKSSSEKAPTKRVVKTEDKPRLDINERLGRRTKDTTEPKARGNKRLLDKKPAAKKPSGSTRGRKSTISDKDKIKHAILRIKNLESRLTVLAAEKAYRNAARAFTKRDATKARLADRVKKISDLTKAIQIRIKNYQKRISALKTV